MREGLFGQYCMLFPLEFLRAFHQQKQYSTLTRTTGFFQVFFIQFTSFSQSGSYTARNRATASFTGITYFCTWQ